MKIEPDKEVVKLAKLVDGYIAGGSIRDLILGRKPNDYDITTPKTPEEMEKILKDNGYKFIPKGVEFGTVSTILPDVGEVELTTYRYETYEDERGRRPLVSWGKTLMDDLERRDFTMNTIAYDPNTGEIIDPFNGIADMQDGVIKWVGDADKRIQDDPLRLIRACRFSARYGFDIDEGQKEAMVRNAGLLKYISRERVWAEIEKSEPYMSKFYECLVETDLAKEVFNQDISAMEEILHDSRGSHYGESIYQHTKDVLTCLDEKGVDDLAVKMAAVFHDTGKMDTRKVEEDKITFIGHDDISVARCNMAMESLKGVPTQMKKKICFIVDQHMMIDPEGSFKSLTRHAVDYRMNGIPKENIEALFELVECDGKKDKTRAKKIILSAYDVDMPDGNQFLHIKPKLRKDIMRQHLLNDVRAKLRADGVQ